MTRRTLLTFAVLAAFAGAASAVPTGWTKLGLSADQKARLTKIAADHREKIKGLFAQIDAEKEAQHAEELAVLSDTQKQLLADQLTAKAGVKKK